MYFFKTLQRLFSQFVLMIGLLWTSVNAADNINLPLTPETQIRLLQEVSPVFILFLEPRDVCALSQVNQSYQKICNPYNESNYILQKIREISEEPAYICPHKSEIIPIVKILEKIAITESFLNSIANNHLLSLITQAKKDYSDKNETVISQILNVAEKVSFSPTFKTLGGSLYMKQLTRNRQQRQPLTWPQSIEASIFSLKKDPVLKCINMAFCTTIIAAMVFEFYHVQYPDMDTFKCYHENIMIQGNECIIPYAETQHPTLRFSIRTPAQTVCVPDYFTLKDLETFLYKNSPCSLLKEQLNDKIFKLDFAISLPLSMLVLKLIQIFYL